MLLVTLVVTAAEQVVGLVVTADTGGVGGEVVG